MTQANNDSDALITARGKAEVTFVANGAESVRETIRTLQQASETAAQKIESAKAKLAASIDSQVKAENRLANAQALNIKQADAINVATIRYNTALAAQGAAIDKVSTLEDKVIKARSEGITNATAIAQAENILEIARTKLITRDLQLERATILLNNARSNAVNTQADEVRLSNLLEVANQRVASNTLVLKQAEDNLTTTTDRLKGAQQGLQNGLNGTANGSNTLTDKTKALTNAKEALRNSLQNLTGSLGNVSGGLSSVSGSAGNALSNLSSIVALDAPMALLAGSILLVVTAVGSMVAIGAEGLKTYRELITSIQQFANSTGTSAESASIFNIAAVEAGTTSKNLSITLGSLNSNLFKLETQFDKAGDSGKNALDKINDKIKNLDLDRLQAITRAKQELDAALNEVAINRSQTLDQSKFVSGQKKDDFNATKETISSNLQERLVELVRAANERIEELTRSHNEKILDLRDKLQNVKEDQALAEAKAEEDLQAKLFAIDQKYADKKLSLQERYFNASPLLRPYLQAAIDNIDKQKAAEEQALKDKTTVEQEKLKRDNANKLASIEEQIARENAAYDRQQTKLQNDLQREEEQEVKSAAKRLAEVQRNYDQEVEAAKRSLAKQLADYEQQQARLTETFKRRIATINEEYAQSLARIKTGEDELLAKPSAAAETPLAKALQALGLNFEELRKLKPDEQLFAIAKALDSYKGDDKAAIISIVAGLFGVDATNFFITLAHAGDSLDEIRKKYKELYPDLVLTQEELEKGFQSGVKWKDIGLIIDNLKTRIGGGLREATDGVADAIARWYADPENRQKLFAFIDGFLFIAKGILKTLTDIFTGNFSLNELLKKIFDPVAGAKTGEDFGRILGKSLATFVTESLKGIATFIKTLAKSPEMIVAFLNFLADVNTTMAAFGIGLVKGIAEGIVDGLPDIKKAFQDVLNTILNLDWQKILGLLNPIVGLANTIGDLIAGGSSSTTVPINIGGGAAGGVPVTVTPVGNRTTQSTNIDNINLTFTSPDVDGKQVFDVLKAKLLEKGALAKV